MLCIIPEIRMRLNQRSFQEASIAHQAYKLLHLRLYILRTMYIWHMCGMWRVSLCIFWPDSCIPPQSYLLSHAGVNRITIRAVR